MKRSEWSECELRYEVPKLSSIKAVEKAKPSSGEDTKRNDTKKKGIGKRPQKFLSKNQRGKVRHHLRSIVPKYSDANLSILADYIVALLAKDGQSELSAFMGDKTLLFVKELFAFIKQHILRGYPQRRLW